MNPMQSKMTDEQQAAQDMVQAVVNQRVRADNENAQLAAQVMAFQRKITELEAKVKELEEAAEKAAPKKIANGKHADEKRPSA